MFREVYHIGGHSAPAFRKRNRGAVLVVACQFFESQRPAIPLARHKAFKHSQRSSLPIRRQIFNGAGKWRRALETNLLRQVSLHLAIRIRTGLQESKQLEDQPIAEEQRCITVFRRAAPDSQGVFRRPADSLKFHPRLSPDRPISRRRLCAHRRRRHTGSQVRRGKWLEKVWWRLEPFPAPDLPPYRKPAPTAEGKSPALPFRSVLLRRPERRWNLGERPSLRFWRCGCAAPCRQTSPASANSPEAWTRVGIARHVPASFPSLRPPPALRTGCLRRRHLWADDAIPATRNHTAPV